jgi:DNA-directed RNA polymerase subunit F
MVVIETEKFLIDKKLKQFLALKVVEDLPSFFMLIREVMEYIERFKELDGQEKKVMIKENIINLLKRQSIFESINTYIPLLEPYIENLILLSKSKLLLNLKKGCFKGCFN